MAFVSIVGLGRVERTRIVAKRHDTLVMTADTGNTLGFEVRARALAQGGCVSVEPDGTLRVGQVDEAVVLSPPPPTFPRQSAASKGGDQGVFRDGIL